MFCVAQCVDCEGVWQGVGNVSRVQQWVIWGGGGLCRIVTLCE